MSLSKNDCPVPFDQQPMNEYVALKQSWLFNWSTYKLQQYIYVTFSLFILLLCILGVFLFLMYSNFFSSLKIYVLDNILIDIIFLFLFIRLYLGWSYIMKRLLSATIFYEESGWYDGQIWIKKSNILMQDRLVGLYQVSPTINKIKYSLLWIILHLIINIILYYYI